MVGFEGPRKQIIPSSDSRLDWLLFFLQENETVETYHQASLYGYQELIDYYPVRREVERNTQIMKQYEDGVSITTLANHFGISPQRIHQIIRGT
jgi:hypothetical protein